jgi:nicotinamide riboside kinase
MRPIPAIKNESGWIDILLKNLNKVAFFDLDLITAQQFMEYLSVQANQKPRKSLSKAGYGLK